MHKLAIMAIIIIIIIMANTFVEFNATEGFTFYQELISSPPGSKHSQSDGQPESSQRNNQEKPGQFIITLPTRMTISPR